jgi:hypothetical protein
MRESRLFSSKPILEDSELQKHLKKFNVNIIKGQSINEGVTRLRAQCLLYFGVLKRTRSQKDALSRPRQDQDYHKSF